MVRRLPDYFRAYCFNHSERLMMFAQQASLFSDELILFFNTKYFIIDRRACQQNCG